MGRASSSTSSPARARLYERTPFTEMAEYDGGTCICCPEDAPARRLGSRMLEQAGVNVGLTHDLTLSVVGRGLGPEGDLRDIRLGVERE